MTTAARTLAAVQNLTHSSFSPATFQAALTTTHLGRYLIYRSVCETTQTISLREANEGAPVGTTVITEEQTRGRGRIQGRNWTSAPKGNLYFTVLLRPLKPEFLPPLNFAVAVSVCSALRAVGVTNAQVKWPNDVVVGTKKICGVLIDAEFQGDAIITAIGVGINVNEDFSQSANEDLHSIATSVVTEFGKVSREELLARVLNSLESLLTAPMSDILVLYASMDALKGKKVTVMPKRKEDPTTYYSATALGFSTEGYLIVRNEKGEDVHLVSEEVSISIR